MSCVRLGDALLWDCQCSLIPPLCLFMLGGLRKPIFRKGFTLLVLQKVRPHRKLCQFCDKRCRAYHFPVAYHV